MIVVADTCSLLMLLRLNPEMLTDPKFECCTTQEVRDEILQTARFAEKYPWRVGFRDRIKVVPLGRVKSAPNYNDALLAVKAQLEHVNPAEGSYNLSREDRSVIVLAQILSELSVFDINDPDDVALSTTDSRLKDFAENRFEIENLEPLAVLNYWLDKGLLSYDSPTYDPILQEWADQEPAPSVAEKKRFRKLTGKTFPQPNPGRSR